MPQTKKIATCCYCGTRAVLVLDKSRHELACSACGAPLHDMKVMPVPARAAEPRHPQPTPFAAYGGKSRRYAYGDEAKKSWKKSKRRKRKPLTRKLFEEIWDVVEDIFD